MLIVGIKLEKEKNNKSRTRFMEKVKALRLFRMRVTGALNDIWGRGVSYGMGIYIPGAVIEIEKLALQLHEELGRAEEETTDGN